MKIRFAQLCISALLTLLTSNLVAQTPPAPEPAPVTSATAPPTTAPSAPPATAAAQQRPRGVPVLISATDESGSPATSLSKEQLTILDTNHAAQALQLMKASDVPLNLGIVLLAAPATFAQQQAAAIDLVNKVIRPNMDHAFVVTARGKKPWPTERLDWKQDPAEITQIVRSLDRNTGIADAFNFSLDTEETGFDENAGRLSIQSFGGGKVDVFDVAFTMMNSDPRLSRRVLVIFREPWSHSHGFGRRVNTTVEGQLQRIIAVAQQLHVTTYVIGLEDTRFNGITDTNIGKVYQSLHAGEDGGAGSANRDFDREMQAERVRAYDNGKTNIQRLAAETGGLTYWSTKKNYPDAVASIANQIAGQYLVVFAPADVPGPIHQLKVTSSSRARVLAPSAYFYGTAK